MMPLSVSRVTRAVCALTSTALLLAGGTLSAQAPAQTPAAKTARASASDAQWLTRPERTDYAETSRYDEVIAYMKQMAAVNPNIHLTTYGYTTEGRPLPLAVKYPASRNRRGIGTTPVGSWMRAAPRPLRCWCAPMDV